MNSFHNSWCIRHKLSKDKIILLKMEESVQKIKTLYFFKLQFDR